VSSEYKNYFVFGGDVQGGDTGTEAHLKVSFWQPLSETMMAHAGVEMTYGDDRFMQKYFGVTGSDVALFPTLGGKAFNASSGVVGWKIPFGVATYLNKEWLLSAGGHYERLVEDAKDSPVVSQRGDANQWVGGIGLSYIF
jgi:MipA family protein